MIYNTISSNNIISKVFSDLNLKEESHRISDMREWIGEGLEKIGAYSYFNIKVTGKENEPILILSDYICKLPNDTYRPIGIAYSSKSTGPFMPLRYGDSAYNTRIQTESTSDLSTVAADNEIVQLAMSLYTLDYESALSLINSDPILKSKLSTLLKTSYDLNSSDLKDSYSKEYSYIINNGYIKTNIRSGYIMLVYQSIPTDENGYAIVPDDPGFIEALYWYIRVKLLYPEWAEGRVRDRVYEHAESKWRFYCKQAYGNAMMPTGDGELESIKNNWLSLIPKINEFDSLFTAMGDKQQIYDQSK